MQSLQTIVPAAIAEMLRHGPMSQAKLEVAWRVAVGDAIARVTKVTLEADALVRVEPVDQRWTDELKRSSRVILNRLQNLLGTGAVTRLSFAPVQARRNDRQQEPRHA